MYMWHILSGLIYIYIYIYIYVPLVIPIEWCTKHQLMHSIATYDT